MLDGIDYNLLQYWEAVGNKPGWGISKIENAIFLKSPTRIPNLNLCLNPSQVSHIEFAQSFFGAKAFGIISDVRAPLPSECSPLLDIELGEMHIAASVVASSEDVARIELVQNDVTLQEWSRLCASINDMDYDDIYAFMAPQLELGMGGLFLAYHNGEPVGTGQVIIDDRQLAYVCSIGVVNDYRRKGFGSKIMNKIICYALERNVQTFALHASEMGRHLYGKLGFGLKKTCSFTVVEGKS